MVLKNFPLAPGEYDQKRRSLYTDFSHLLAGNNTRPPSDPKWPGHRRSRDVGMVKFLILDSGVEGKARSFLFATPNQPSGRSRRNIMG